MKVPRTALVIALLAGAVPAAEAQPAFTKGPTAIKTGDRVKIDFTVDRDTDVAVYVEDADGKIVRHLAAGVLGKNAPEPLRSNSLAQSLEWDGKDDLGKPAAGRSFQVRVLMGMKPRFDGFLLHNPQAS